MGILNKIKIYTIGSMEYQNGEVWRNSLKSDLSPIGLTILDPYHKQFIQKIDESDEKRRELNSLRENERWDELSKFCKEFRSFDLAMVDKSDATVWHLDVTVPTIGSVEEFSWSVRLKRPSYVVVKQGKIKCPLWIFGMVPHQYILNDLSEFVQEIFDIDSGKKELDNRWRLFEENLR